MAKIQKSSFVSSFDVIKLWGWILLAWSFYRYFFRLSEPVDEFIFKPLVFVLPVVWYVTRKEKRSVESLGITGKNFFPSVYIGLGLGFLFALEGIVANFLKYGDLTIVPIKPFQEYGFLLLVISLATAASEELLGRGFIFSRLLEKSNDNMVYAALYSSAMFAALHVPILLTTLKYEGMTLVLFFVTGVAVSLANCVLFRYTKSLVGPVLVHLFWNMTVALYL